MLPMLALIKIHMQMMSKYREEDDHGGADDDNDDGDGAGYFFWWFSEKLSGCYTLLSSTTS